MLSETRFSQRLDGVRWTEEEKDYLSREFRDPAKITLPGVPQAILTTAFLALIPRR
jgi:hypothetical protein